MATIDADTEIALVILQVHIVAGAVPLDKDILQDQGLFLRVGDDEIDRGDAGDEGLGLGVPVVRPDEITLHPVPEGLGLADVDEGPRRVPEEIDPRFPGKPVDGLRRQRGQGGFRKAGRLVHHRRKRTRRFLTFLCPMGRSPLSRRILSRISAAFSKLSCSASSSICWVRVSMRASTSPSGTT